MKGFLIIKYLKNFPNIKFKKIKLNNLIIYINTNLIIILVFEYF